MSGQSVSGWRLFLHKLNTKKTGLVEIQVFIQRFLYTTFRIFSQPNIIKSEFNASRIIINYWTWTYTKISWFVGGKQIKYLPMTKAEVNTIDLRTTDKTRYFATIVLPFTIKPYSACLLANITVYKRITFIKSDKAKQLETERSDLPCF